MDSRRQPPDLFNFQHNLSHKSYPWLALIPSKSHILEWKNRTHSISLTRPHYCPSALIFLMPPRGIGWDCTAMECSPLAQGSKCSRAKGKESNNKIIGFVTLQIYREANSLYLWAHEVARVRRGVWGKQQRSQSDVNPPEALTQRNGELLPLVTILFDHLEMDRHFQNHLPIPFHSPSRQRADISTIWRKPENIREQQLCSKHQPTFFFSILPFVVTFGMQRLNTKPFGVQHVRLSLSLSPDSILGDKSLTVQTSTKKKQERNKHSTSCSFFFRCN